MTFRQIIAGAVCVISPIASANAQTTTYCVNCDTLQQGVLSYVRQAQQLVQELQTAQNTLNFYLNSVKNLERLPTSVYRDVTGDIVNIQRLITQATMLQGFAKQMLTNLGTPTGYPDSQQAVGWENLLAKENNAVSLAMTQAAQTISDQGPQLTDDAANLARLQNEAMGDDGQQKSLETIAGITATSASMTQKSQQTTTATQQAALTYYTAQADRQALFDAANHAQLVGVGEGACRALAQTGYTTDACTANGG